ncbi:hypothetical protein BDZ94DRAFT_1296643 [Collybia nuda]|uniref:Uncharacterized protein n=1 Tax=Collybia nuda TaxID=64659 RepID=A0A9P5YAG1_9AGAR|nr:hypothetical protein BDZ94DRAFT_1296643 [Collybia nuda]
MADNSTLPPIGGNPNAPQEPPFMIVLEKEDFVGMHLADMLYGISALLFFQCMAQLLWPKRGRDRNLILAGYTFLLFSLGTVFTGMNINVAILGFIENRNFPGGPEAYSSFTQSSALGVIPNAAFILSNWMADALMLWRCKVIWNGKLWVLIFPCIMYLASISMGIMTIYQSSRPNSDLWTTVTVNFGLPYFSISSALNILLTLMIVVRLSLHYRKFKDTLGRRFLSQYKGVITMLVESSAIYAISSILFIGTYGANNTISVLFIPILSQTQIIAPLLIISRVSKRKAWTEDSATHPGDSLTLPSSMGGTTTQIDAIGMKTMSPDKNIFPHRKESSSINLTESQSA